MLSRCCQAEMTVQAGECSAYYECVACRCATLAVLVLVENETEEEKASD